MRLSLAVGATPAEPREMVISEGKRGEGFPEGYEVVSKVGVLQILKPLSKGEQRHQRG